ncbi:hypothetical protein PQR36_30880 [Paraburkholderia nemoris]|uniref:hypothetical protein n=1 Tax=Paraburkholderia nemoris TaxID=2793076 RepID=UPI0038B7D05A
MFDEAASRVSPIVVEAANAGGRIDINLIDRRYSHLDSPELTHQDAHVSAQLVARAG